MGRGVLIRGRRFGPALARAGLPQEVRLYDLRHATASVLLMRGVPATRVAERLGHMPSMTLDVYGHAIADGAERAAEALGEAFGEISHTVAHRRRDRGAEGGGGGGRKWPKKLAEGVGFEPTDGLRHHLISSQARSTGLRHPSARDFLSESAGLAPSCPRPLTPVRPLLGAALGACRPGAHRPQPAGREQRLPGAASTGRYSESRAAIRAADSRRRSRVTCW